MIKADANRDVLKMEKKKDLLSYAASNRYNDLTTKSLTSKQTLEKLHLARVPKADHQYRKFKEIFDFGLVRETLKSVENRANYSYLQ